MKAHPNSKLGAAAVERAADYVRKLTRSLPKPGLGIILGSGLGDFTLSLTEQHEIPFSSIPHFPTSSVSGHPGKMVFGRLGGGLLCCLQGRVHYYEGYPMDRVIFPVRVMASLGIDRIVVTNAAGGISRKLSPGHLMLIRDHLSLFVPNPLVGSEFESFGPQFPDMSRCYSARLSRLAKQCARKSKVQLHEGVYAGVTGPSYETPAEIRALRRLGADAVGMSTVPEVIAAKQLGMECLALSVITNVAAGISRTPLSHGEVLKVTQQVRPVFVQFLTFLCEAILAAKMGKKEKELDDRHA